MPGLFVVAELRESVPDGASIVQMALRWILMHDAVARAAVSDVGKRMIVEHTHARW